MPSFPSLQRVPIAVPFGAVSPLPDLPVPPGGTEIDALVITERALSTVEQAAVWSVGQKLRSAPEVEVDAKDFAHILSGIAVVRIVWAHIAPHVIADMSDADDVRIDGRPSADGSTTYRYMDRFSFTVQVQDRIATLDTPTQPSAN